jgi:hypothetical protein
MNQRRKLVIALGAGAGALAALFDSFAQPGRKSGASANRMKHEVQVAVVSRGAPRAGRI